jgi:hypothetical protein
VADPRAYLDQVAAHLPFVDEVKREVVTELTDHIEDSIDGELAHGRSLSEATEIVLTRLGSPADLAESLRRAHQTPRRVLAAAGVGVSFAFGHGVSAGIRALMLTTFPLFLVGIGLTRVRDDSTFLINEVSNTALTWMWLAVSYALGRSLPFVVAKASRRSLIDVSRAVGLVGAIVGGWFLWSFYRVDLDWFSVWPLVLAPAVFVAGAWRSTEQSWLPRLRSRWFVIAVAYLALVTAIVVAGHSPVEHARPSRDQLAASFFVVGDTAAMDRSDAYMTVRDRGAFHGIVVEELDPSTGEVWAEVWAALPDMSALDRTRSQPLAATRLEYGEYVEPTLFELNLLGVELFGPGPVATGYHGRIADAHHRNWGPAFVMLVETAADGSRHVLEYKEPFPRPLEFTGSVIEWFSAR